MRYGLTMISPTNPRSAIGTNIAACHHRQPAATTTINAINMINVAVPKSSTAIPIATKPVNAIGGRKPRQKLFIFSPRRTHHHATINGIPHLAISLGWNVNGPKLTQRRAPFTSRPIPGTWTRIIPAKIATMIHHIGLSAPRAVASFSTGSLDPINRQNAETIAKIVARPPKMASKVVLLSPLTSKLAELTKTTPNTNRQIEHRAIPCPALSTLALSATVGKSHKVCSTNEYSRSFKCCLSTSKLSAVR